LILALFTFYAYIGLRKTKIPVLSIDEAPSDWGRMKQLLTEVMTTVHIKHGIIEAQVTMERHKSGKWTVVFSGQGYGTQKLRYKREIEAFFKVRYSPKADAVEVVRAAFSWNLNRIAQDFYQMEKGIQYRTPPLIPRQHMQSILENPKLLLMGPSGQRGVDYSIKPPQLYNRKEDEETPRGYKRQPILAHLRRKS